MESPQRLDFEDPAEGSFGAAPGPAELELENIRRSFGNVDALAGLNLAIGPAEIVCLLGPLKSGKTTALRIVTGTERPNSGHVRIGGRLVAGDGTFIPPARRPVGYIGPEPTAQSRRSLASMLGADLKHLNEAERSERVVAAAERVGLDALARSAKVLSKADRFRAALARILAAERRLIVLDQPFDALERELRAAARDDAIEGLRKTKTAALIATDDVADALQIADRIVLMRQGAVVQTAAPELLWRRPKSAWAAAFLGEVNTMPGIAQAGRVLTPWGTLFRPNLRDGPVQILVREAELRAAPRNGSEPELVVEATKYLGPAYLIVGTLVSATFGRTQLRARVALREAPAPGAKIRLGCEPNAILIFSVES